MREESHNQTILREKYLYSNKKKDIWQSGSPAFYFLFFKSQTDIDIYLVHQLIKYMTLRNHYIIVI